MALEGRNGQSRIRNRRMVRRRTASQSPQIARRNTFVSPPNSRAAIRCRPDRHDAHAEKRAAPAGGQRQYAVEGT